MTPVYHSSTILSNTLVGDQVRHLILKPEHALAYEAGQFFLLRLRHPQSGEYVERSYSAANFGPGETIEFVIRIESQGQMTSLIDQLVEGDQIDIKGPFGRFGSIDIPEDAQRLVLIGGGVGISPLRSVIQQQLQSDHPLPLQVFYGFRTPQDFLFQTELEAAAQQGRLQLVTAISQEGFPEWEGHRGYITEVLEGDLFPADPQTHAFICGPPAMVKATRQKLYDLGYQRPTVHIEAW